MNELYSRPLSPEAEEALGDFAAHYIRSLMSKTADYKAEIAKAAALRVLQETDIDILVFVTFCAMFSMAGVPLVALAFNGSLTPEQAAAAMVASIKKGIRADKQTRPGGASQ